MPASALTSPLPPTHPPVTTPFSFLRLRFTCHLRSCVPSFTHTHTEAQAHGMATVPRGYYDACTQVRRHYAAVTSAPASATLTDETCSLWSVYTLPPAEPDVEFVLEHFPLDSAAAAPARPPIFSRRNTGGKATSSIDVVPQGPSLEERYDLLLRRITDELTGPSAAN